MTVQTLIQRFSQSTFPWELDFELSNLLKIELEGNLTDEQKSSLNDFKIAFEWETSYRINCEYVIPTYSLCGFYEVDNLNEFISIEEGQEIVSSCNEINITIDDIEGGEFTVDNKEVVIHGLRIKQEFVELLDQKNDL